MDIITSERGHPELDPAVLAFVKCHVTSFLRWDTLRLLVSCPERWTDASEVAGKLHKPPAEVASTLRELDAEGIVEAQASPSGAVAYRMDPREPSTRVVERLVAATTRSQELRLIILARVLNQERLAS